MEDIKRKEQEPLLSDRRITDNAKAHGKTAEALGISEIEASARTVGYIHGGCDVRSFYESARSKDIDLIGEIIQYMGHHEFCGSLKPGR